MIELIFNLLTFPLMIIFAPIDMLLNMIPNISIVPTVIGQGVSFIGKIPETMFYLIGLNPIIWNLLLGILLLYLTVSPVVNGFKRFWAWVRP